MSPQTVTFPCPFCGRRMGVPAELLGKQVRCPHCKQVVLAPLNVAPSGIVPAVNLPPPPLSMVGPNAQTQAISAPNVPPPPAPEPDLPTFAIQRREGADSILSGPGESEDEVFSQPGGGRLPAAPPLDLSGPTAPRPTVSDDNPFEIASTAPTAAVGAVGPRPNAPAATSELPNPFLELEPVTLPAAFQPAVPPGGRPAGLPPAPFQQPAPPPKPAFPTPAAFPSAPLPAPAPAANPFAGIDDPTVRPLPGPVPLPVPVPAPEATTESADDQPRKRRRSRREEEEAPPAKVAEEKPHRGARARGAAAAPGGVGNVLLFVAIGYGVLITALAVWALFIRPPTIPPEHPLSTIPDNFGEFDPAVRKKLSLGPNGAYKFNVDGELPQALRATLGSPITVGKMEVTPLRVERRPLVIERVPLNGPQLPPEPTKTDALVLVLAIKNASDVSFHPMDPAFTRKANDQKKDFPITRVVVDKKKYYAGGFLNWPTDPNRVKRIFEQQQLNDVKSLAPGQTQEYVVFTDANNGSIISDAMKAQELQWRVEVRRPPVELGGKEIPVTAIVGVDFKWNDVKKTDLQPPPR